MAKIKVVQQHMKACSNMEETLTPGASIYRENLPHRRDKKRASPIRDALSKILLCRIMIPM